MARTTPDIAADAEVHVAGPLEPEVATTSRTVLVQRCLRCDLVLAVVSSDVGASFKLGTQIGIIYETGRSRIYVADRRPHDYETDCVDRIGR